MLKCEASAASDGNGQKRMHFKRPGETAKKGSLNGKLEKYCAPELF